MDSGKWLLSKRATDLITYAVRDGRICPQPMLWSDLHKLLLGAEKNSDSLSPLPPLILGVWHCTSGLDKILRLREQIQWADQNGAINKVDAFLRSLHEKHWFHCND